MAKFPSAGDKLNFILKNGDRYPARWLARQLDMHERNVRDAAMAFGVILNNSKMTADQYDNIFNALADGWSNEEIRRTYGVDSRTIKRWFPQSGWGASSGGWLVEAERDMREAERVKYA